MSGVANSGATVVDVTVVVDELVEVTGMDVYMSTRGNRAWPNT